MTATAIEPRGSGQRGDGTRGPLQRFASDPLTVFLLAGAGIFGLYASFNSTSEQAVRYDARIQQALVEEFEFLAGRPARPEDIAKIKHDFLTDELLFREAVERGIHLTDGEVRERMVQKVRYLVAGAPVEPSEMEVLDYYAQNLDRYEREPEITFDQVFFEEAPERPAALLAALRGGREVAGDELWTGPSYPDYGHSMIRGIFGQDFLEQLAAASPGQWIGPLRSSRGWHFVLKRGSAPARLLPFAIAREQVRQDMIIARMQQEIDRVYEDLAEKYEVRIDA